MRRFFLIIFTLVCISLLFVEIANAQEVEPIKLGDLFSWAKTTPIDWVRGGLYAGLGLIGALVTIFGLIGGAVPGTAGQAKIDSDSDRLERLSKRLEVLISNDKPDAESISVIEKTVNNFRDDLRAERWRQFLIATVFYAILGAFFSALLAKDILQALVIGAGWTSFVGTLGLKKDYEARKATKNASLEKTMTRAKELEKKLRESGQIETMIDFEPFEDLEREVNVAQKL